MIARAASPGPHDVLRQALEKYARTACEGAAELLVPYVDGLPYTLQLLEARANRTFSLEPAARRRALAERALQIAVEAGLVPAVSVTDVPAASAHAANPRRRSDARNSGYNLSLRSVRCQPRRGGMDAPAAPPVPSASALLAARHPEQPCTLPGLEAVARRLWPGLSDADRATLAADAFELHGQPAGGPEPATYPELWSAALQLFAENLEATAADLWARVQAIGGVEHAPDLETFERVYFRPLVFWMLQFRVGGGLRARYLTTTGNGRVRAWFETQRIINPQVNIRTLFARACPDLGLACTESGFRQCADNVRWRFEWRMHADAKKFSDDLPRQPIPMQAPPERRVHLGVESLRAALGGQADQQPTPAPAAPARMNVMEWVQSRTAGVGAVGEVLGHAECASSGETSGFWDETRNTHVQANAEVSKLATLPTSKARYLALLLSMAERMEAPPAELLDRIERQLAAGGEG